MITLYHFMRVWGIPDGSPFCVKLETYLRMAGIEYINDTTMDIRKAPKGKFPAIEHNGRVMGDSSLIIQALKQEFGDPVDGHLTTAQQAQSLALQRLVEDHLYWIGLYFRWGLDESWTELKPVFFARLPLPLRWFVPELVRIAMLRNCRGQGVSRHTIPELAEMAREDLTALSTALGEAPFFFGDRATTLDAVVFGMIANIVYCSLPSPLRDVVRSFPKLVQHTERMMAAYFPELNPQHHI